MGSPKKKANVPRFSHVSTWQLLTEVDNLMRGKKGWICHDWSKQNSQAGSRALYGRRKKKP